MPTTRAVSRASVESSTTFGSATSGSSRIAGAWLPRYRTRSPLAAANCSTVTEPGPSGASVITAFMPLRWSAATISILPDGVEIAALARRSSVVSWFIDSSFILRRAALLVGSVRWSWPWGQVGWSYRLGPRRVRQQAGREQRGSVAGLLVPVGHRDLGQHTRPRPLDTSHPGPAAGEQRRSG